MNRRRQLLLALLALFEEHEQEEQRREISLSEVLESVQEIQRGVNLGYTFAKDVFYSRNLLQDIAWLSRRGYLDEYRYIHDSFLPKGFVRLTRVGQGEGRAKIATLPGNLREDFYRAIGIAKDRFSQRWKLFGRAARMRS